MRDHKQFGISGKGYYIALILCAAAIGISGYLYHQSNVLLEEQASLTQADEAQPVLNTDPAPELPVQATENAASSAPASAKPAVPAPSAPSPTVPSQTEQASPKNIRTAAPIQGENIFGYSMDCLSYNETTRDWRVHNGMDIAAEDGAEVCAAADGTVYTTYEDDALGSTVVIRHDGGYTTRYSSLSPELKVKPGDTVKLGQPIGTAGCTALVETTLGSHIHFAVTYRDNPMDPEEFLSLG